MWLQSIGKFRFLQEDIQFSAVIEKIILDFQPDVIFHLAGQVAMSTSLANPRLDFEVNTLGSYNLLEAVREYSPNSRIIFSSTNKVYGELESISYEENETRYYCPEYPEGFDERLPLNFHTPYGCSKGAADQYMLDYARMFGLKTVVFRHSSVFGLRQFSTSDQGWVGWFIQQALETQKQPNREPFTICGNGKQVRDILFIKDLVRCYFEASEKIDRTRGQSFNIGGGISNSLSLLELFKILENELKIQLRFERLPWRQGDQKVFVAMTSKAQEVFGWSPRIDKISGIKEMISWIQSYVS
jgi:CDP-paratose 2-epimerase